jgi:hypothetical protein
VQNERLGFITCTLWELTHSDVNQVNIVQTSTTMTSVKKRPAEPSHSIFWGTTRPTVPAMKGATYAAVALHAEWLHHAAVALPLRSTMRRG